ncbi:Thoeris anti-defense Tad2 family protein [Mitsuokella sp.]|uniref:Thoeris anti-defense Tad2 family protein n=1 Tax=Mitsuokella sp. TaxID=2049034 RepID=UPI003D7F1738
MTFGDALEQMKAGRQCSRSAWIFRDVVYTKYTSDMTPYLVVKAGDADPIPYWATDIDIFSNDWEVVL